jgi:hypothetical protein
MDAAKLNSMHEWLAAVVKPNTAAVYPAHSVLQARSFFLTA